MNAQAIQGLFKTLETLESFFLNMMVLDGESEALSTPTTVAVAPTASMTPPLSPNIGEQTQPQSITFTVSPWSENATIDASEDETETSDTSKNDEGEDA